MQDLPSTFFPHHRAASATCATLSPVQTSSEYRVNRTCKRPSDMADEKFSWSHEATCDLIQLYKKHPVLYATLNSDYKNKGKRMEALKSIRAELLTRGKRTTIDDIKRKIHGLRTQYAHQLSKMKRCESEELKPTLWCFSQLEFLRNSGCDNQGAQDETMINESKDLGEFNVFEQNHNDDSQDTGSFYDDILIKQEVSNSIPHTPVFASDVGKSTRGEDDLSTFGKLVELELRKIGNGHLLRKAKREIINVLMDAQEAGDD